MRKIERRMLAAVKKNISLKMRKDEWNSHTGQYLLYGKCIAKLYEGKLLVSLAEHSSRVTLSRLRNVFGVRLDVKRGNVFLNPVGTTDLGVPMHPCEFYEVTSGLPK